MYFLFVRGAGPLSQVKNPQWLQDSAETGIQLVDGHDEIRESTIRPMVEHVRSRKEKIEKMISFLTA